MLLAASTDVWRFQVHLEIWVLIGAIVAGYVYMARRIGPSVVPAGRPPVTRTQWWLFAAAVGVLWAASDWPLHDLAEEYLYSAHMVQHMMLTYFAPPLFLMAIPEWMARLLIGQPGSTSYKVVRVLTRPLVAGVLFNVMVVVSHIPDVVNRSASNGTLHYGIHLMLVTSALLMWTCVVGPIPEFRISFGGRMIYLFAMSIIPTVPAGWLTFAEGTVYKHYDTTVRVFGLSPTADQQIAGLIMKVGGSIFLWSIIVVLFFNRFAKNWEQENSLRRTQRIPDAEITGNDEEPLTYDEVAQAFDRVPAAVEPAGPRPPAS